MSEFEEKIPRLIESSLGDPEGDPKFADLFCLNFVEAGGEDGFQVMTGCLCTLKAATEAWLQNQATIEEVQALIAHQH